MNKKGQALVEFLLILPIFITIILALFDYVKINQTKMNLENNLEDIILYEKPVLDGAILTKDVDGNTVSYILRQKVDLISPVLQVILSNDYEVEVRRDVYE